MRIFISNIEYDSTENDLLQILRESECQLPKSVRIVRDPEGNSRGFGFAHFDNERAALQAIKALDGVHLNGRRLNATQARDDRPAPRRLATAGKS